MAEVRPGSRVWARLVFIGNGIVSAEIGSFFYYIGIVVDIVNVIIIAIVVY